MVKHPTPTASSMSDGALLRRISEVSRDTAPEAFPEMTTADDFELMRWREAETHFQYALRQRTWMRLSAEERALVRQRVLKSNSYYRDRMGSSGFEAACEEEVGILIGKVRKQTT